MNSTTQPPRGNNFNQSITPRQNSALGSSRPGVGAGTLQAATGGGVGGGGGNAEGTQAEEEPGFFGRLFGAKKKPEEVIVAAPVGGGGEAGSGGDPNQPAVEVAQSAGWCGSKQMDAESAEALRSAPLAPSK